jgi:hypothetical protein
MRLDGDYESRPGNAHAKIQVADTGGLRAVSRPARLINFADQVNSVLPWLWIFPNPISTSSNTAVQVRYGQSWFLRRTTNKWERLCGGRPSAGFEATFEIVDMGGWFDGQISNVKMNGGLSYVSSDIAQVVPAVIDGKQRIYELWLGDCHGYSNPEIIGHDIRAVFATVQVRIVVLDPSKSDDRVKARFTAQLGYDFWDSMYSLGDHSMKEDVNGSPIPEGSNWKPGYPRHQMDGGNARYKWITSEWQSFNVISIQPKYGSHLPAPWSIQNLYAEPPYVLTLEELRANPPPMVGK